MKISHVSEYIKAPVFPNMLSYSIVLFGMFMAVFNILKAQM